MELGSAETGPDWGRLLASTPFAAALAKGAPLWVAAGDPPHVLFATPAALAAFGAPDPRSLEDSLFSTDSLSSRRLLRLAGEMPENGPARLELLRFFVHRQPVSVFWLCARLRRGHETFFVASDPTAAGVVSSSLRADRKQTAKAEPIARLDAPVRFVWRLDRDGRYGATDPTLADRLGAQAPREGEALDVLSARVGLGPEWAGLITARQSFSGLRVAWPEAGLEFARVIKLSGAPLLASGGDFQGFRGFGVITGERSKASARLARPPDPPKAMAPPAAPAAGAKPVTPGDAAALISLLQRQHGAAKITAPPANASAPALAVITALAALLAPKAAAPANAPSAVRAKSPEPPASPVPSGAEIVVLRPHVSPAADPTSIAREARESESVALSSQERAAFKEIARALGANVRGGRPEDEPADGGGAPPSSAEEPREAPAVGAPTPNDYAALLDNLPLAALLVRDGDPLYANRTLLDLTGYRDLADFRARNGLKTIFRGRDPQTLAPGGMVAGVPLVGSGDRILTVDAQVRPAMWQGEPAVLVAMRRSREAEHQAELRAIERETEMHAARARDLAAALDAARDGMVRLDRNGRVLGMNKGAENLLGFDQKETAGESFLTLLEPASQPAVRAALERLVSGASGPLESLEAVARSQDGRLLPVGLDMGRLPNQPEPDYFLLLTDRGNAEFGGKENQSAREQAEKDSTAKTELLSRVSHEMRTPLHAIMGFTEIMLEERFGPIGNERYRDYVRDIHTSSRHVLSLANDLLDIAKLELGKVDLQFAPLAVNAVIRECVTLMQPQAAREHVIMRLSLYERLPNVMADERSLRQIMLNLMANAVKYNEPGGQVIVSTAVDDDGGVIVRVRDTGVGMNESELAIALEPFRRVPGAKAVEGAGLGLPLAKALVEANHADFSIKSRKDQGTLIEIAFQAPRAAQ